MYGTSGEEMIDLIVGLISLGFVGLMSIAGYFIGIYGFLKLADSTNYKHKWIAFIPVLRTLILTKLMDDKVTKFLRGKLNWFLVVLPLLVFPAIFIIGFILGFIGELSTGTDAEIIFILMILGFILLSSFISLIWSIIFYCVTFKFYDRYSKNGILWFIATVMFGFLGLNVALAVFGKDVSEVEEKLVREEAERKEFEDYRLDKDKNEIISTEEQDNNISSLKEDN